MIEVTGLLDRTVVFVLYSQPFVDWLNETCPPVEGKFTLDELRNDEGHCFLIPEFDHPEDTEQYINKRKPKLFRHILLSWYEDPDRFPKEISGKTFDEWFELHYATVVEDLVEGNVTKQSWLNP